MKINEYNQMMKWLTRPKDNFTPEKKKKIIQDHYKKAEEPKSKPMNILKYINTMNRLYSNSEDPKYIEPKEMEDIKKSLPVSEMVKKPKKKKESSWKYTSWADGQKDIEEMKIKDKAKEKIIKKTLIVEKPKTKPVPISPLPYDWREGIWHDLEDEDPYYNWGPKPSEDVRKILNIKKREVAGLEALLNLHKKKHG